MTPPFDFEAFPRLETPRLVLREIRPGDAPALLAHLGDLEVTRYLDMGPLADVAQAQGRIRDWATEFANRRGIRWAIALREDAALIGTCGYPVWGSGLTYPPGVPGLTEAAFAYDLARGYWGRGLMAEALAAMLRFGFERMDLRRVHTQVALEDPASARMLDGLGLHKEGVLASR